MFTTRQMMWNPWREMSRLQREMNRVFRDVEHTQMPSYPAVNIWTKSDEAIVTVELPGYEVDNLNISVVDDNLTIKGERPAVELKEGETYHRQERACGGMSRTIRLPFNIESDKVEAKMNNGILSVKLPRAEKDKPRKISIQSK